MIREDETAIEMLDQFGADSHFQIAKASAVVCIDQIIETIFKYETIVEADRIKDGISFWHKVKLKLWKMRITEYTDIKNMNN